MIEFSVPLAEYFRILVRCWKIRSHLEFTLDCTARTTLPRRLVWSASFAAVTRQRGHSTHVCARHCNLQANLDSKLRTTTKASQIAA